MYRHLIDHCLGGNRLICKIKVRLCEFQNCKASDLAFARQQWHCLEVHCLEGRCNRLHANPVC